MRNIEKRREREERHSQKYFMLSAYSPLLVHTIHSLTKYNTTSSMIFCWMWATGTLLKKHVFWHRRCQVTLSSSTVKQLHLQRVSNLGGCEWATHRAPTCHSWADGRSKGSICQILIRWVNLLFWGNSEETLWGWKVTGVSVHRLYCQSNIWEKMPLIEPLKCKFHQKYFNRDGWVSVHLFINLRGTQRGIVASSLNEWILSAAF